MRHERVGSVVLTVKNVSGIAAQRLRVAVNVSGAYLIADDSKRRDELKPPERPHGRYLGDMAYQIGRYAGQVQEEDPLAFKWIKRPGSHEHGGIYQAQEFRATEQTSFTELVYGPDTLPASGTIGIEISATNLPEPVPISAVFTMTETKRDWSDAKILELLDQDLADVMIKHGIA
jgi:hypothetical protein